MSQADVLLKSEEKETTNIFTREGNILSYQHAELQSSGILH
jgi:hypothetical protein